MVAATVRIEGKIGGERALPIARLGACDKLGGVSIGNRRRDPVVRRQWRDRSHTAPNLPRAIIPFVGP
jgi:hypothetical protein